MPVIGVAEHVFDPANGKVGKEIVVLVICIAVMAPAIAIAGALVIGIMLADALAAGERSYPDFGHQSSPQ
jgi:hypothetical protein